MTRDSTKSASVYSIEVREGTGSAHSLALALTGHDRLVLELGCSAGHVSTALKARGHTVVGVELDPASAEQARGIADRVITADLDSAVLSDLVVERNFDVVLMGDVLEHLRDPLAVLRESVSLMAPDGFAVVSIPNVAFVDVRTSLLDGHWNYLETGLLDDTHLRFFTRKSLFELAQDAGLVVTELHRVLKGRGTSNVATADPMIAGIVADIVPLDPNASTYVFVAKFAQQSTANDVMATELEMELRSAEEEAERHIRSVVQSRLGERASLLDSRRELIALKNRRLFRIAHLTLRVCRKAVRVIRRTK